MSEEKIIKHSENAVKILKNESASLKEKIMGFTEEIIIIIIAVSITLALHNWNDRRHEKEIERNFLMGISSDLKQSAQNLTGAIAFFQPTIDYYNEVCRQMNSGKIDSLYIDSSAGYLLNTMYFSFDGSRFEGFKSSGYLRLIENEQLLNHLVRLYSVNMTFQKDADTYVFHMREQDYMQYIGMKAERDSKGRLYISRLLSDRGVRFQIYRFAEYFAERKRQKEALMKEMLAVVTEIDQELNK